jgi:hypothetical protein
MPRFEKPAETACSATVVALFLLGPLAAARTRSQGSAPLLWFCQNIERAQEEDRFAFPV